MRGGNEDSFLVVEIGQRAAEPLAPGAIGAFLRARPLLLAVSDGMGGAAAGDVASALTVQSLQHSLVKRGEPPREDWDALLREVVNRANRVVLEAARDPDKRGMGATLTAVCLHGEHAHVAEVGDSRAYLFRRGKLDLLTHDQSYVQLLVDKGVITEQEAEESPQKNIILSVIGGKRDVRVDIGDLRVEAGDTILVCSDGLTNELSAEEIAAILSASAEPDACCAALVAAANQHGGRDNITVVVANIG